NHVGWPGLHLAYKNETATPPSPTFILDEAYQYLIHKRGILATNGGLNFVGNINVNNANSKYPDIQIYHFHYPRWHVDNVNTIWKVFPADEEIKQNVLKMLQEVDMAVPMPCLQKPKSSGELWLRSKDPAVPVKIYANTFSQQEDVETMLKSLDFIKKMLKTETFKRRGVWLHHLDIPGCRHTKPDSEEYWRCHLRHLSIMFYHPVGSVKMGPRSDPTAVVDARLRVHGMQGLRVIDASIMPTITSGPTNAPTIMIGEKGADLIKENWAAVKDNQEL
ncbi:PREDICTED: glucose dehydrogenase [FAD, quinone]-like, partial [Dinoponera quadriceps]|uniref:Glucose dehydrogenase [FAD, quinone]-like n=1 Tax=Dinoponera quadriceps TaxID=609295 RepID=A0A6P3YAV6_DINQU